MDGPLTLIWKLLTEVPQYHIEDITSHRMMKIQMGHIDSVQSDTNVQLSGLIWPNWAILVKLRMRKCVATFRKAAEVSRFAFVAAKPQKCFHERQMRQL